MGGRDDHTTGVRGRGDPSFNTFALGDYLTGLDLSCPCCGQLKIHADLISVLNTLATCLGRKPKIVYGYLCANAARAWARDNRIHGVESKATGEHRVAARLNISTVPLHKGIAVVLGETGPGVLDIARQLGLKATVTEDGMLLQLDTATPRRN